MSASITHPLTFATLEDVRPWIGRRLALKKPLGEFGPGASCIIMCAVDFGEGLLLWVKTEDTALRDVGQFELTAISEYFIPSRMTATESPTGSPRPISAAVHGVKARVAGALRRIPEFCGELARSFESAREAAYVAERYLSLSDDLLAARGRNRIGVSKQIRDILCRND